jgi:hypothetical protein
MLDRRQRSSVLTPSPSSTSSGTAQRPSELAWEAPDSEVLSSIFTCGLFTRSSFARKLSVVDFCKCLEARACRSTAERVWRYPDQRLFETNESCFRGNSIFGSRRAARRRRHSVQARKRRLHRTCHAASPGSRRKVLRKILVRHPRVRCFDSFRESVAQDRRIFVP